MFVKRRIVAVLILMLCGAMLFSACAADTVAEASPELIGEEEARQAAALGTLDDFSTVDFSEEQQNSLQVPNNGCANRGWSRMCRF